MARRAEEEENHWPGFVDALSTIVMVVTFLLIILGIVIFVISLQINDPTKQESAGSGGVQVAEVEQELEQTSRVVVELSDVVEKQEQEIEQLTRAVSEAMAQAEAARQAQAQAQAQAEARIEASREDAGDTREVVASAPPATIEIVVPVVEEEQQQGGASQARSQVQTAQAVMTVLFEGSALELNEESNRQALDFLEQNDVVEGQQEIEIMSFYDGDALSLSQARRTAYFRLLSVRNALLDSGVEGERISISVLPAPSGEGGAANVNRVKVFLR